MSSSSSSFHHHFIIIISSFHFISFHFIRNWLGGVVPGTLPTINFCRVDPLRATPSVDDHFKRLRIPDVIFTSQLTFEESTPTGYPKRRRLTFQESTPTGYPKRRRPVEKGSTRSEGLTLWRLDSTRLKISKSCIFLLKKSTQPRGNWSLGTKNRKSSYLWWFWNLSTQVPNFTKF